MAEIRLNSRCKVCNLIKTDPDLWEELHKLVFEKGKNKSQALLWLNGQIKARYSAVTAENAEQATTFNHTNLSRHFREHISSLDKVKIILASRTKEHGGAFTEQDQAQAERIAAEIQAPVMEEYAIWKELLDFSLEAAVSLKNDLQKKTNNRRGLSHLEIENYAECLTKIASVKQHLAKLQDKEQMLETALTDFATSVATDLFNKLQNTSLSIEEMLKAEFPNSSIADRSADFIRKVLAEDVRIILKASLDRVKSQWK